MCCKNLCKGGDFIANFEFTYLDYLKCIGKYKESDELIYKNYEEDIVSVNEDTAEYISNDGKSFKERNIGDKKHDKIFKDIFNNTLEVAKFLCDFMNININKDDLILQNTNFITKNYKYNQADILYKIKNKNVYFLIEQQTKVDYSMSYRILNYCIEIIRNAVGNNEINFASNKFPKVIPIVLYTGNQNWTASTRFSDIEENFSDFNINSIDAQYTLIDINKYNFDDLLKMDSMISNIMVLEKCKTNEDVLINLKKIINNNKTNLYELKRIVSYLYSTMNNVNDLINLIEESESVEVMSTIAERLREEYDNRFTDGIAKGISQTISKIIKNMLLLKIPEKDILRYTNIDKKEFDKIKNELLEENKL